MLLAAVTVLVGIAVGYLRGGRLARVAAARLVLVWALVAGVAAQAALVVLAGADVLAGDQAEVARRSALYASLLAVLAFAWANRRLPGMTLILVGLALNAAVIVPNGAMPVSADAIAALGGEEAIDPGKHRLLTDDDVLPWLADVIPVPGLRIVVSAGDIVLALGVGLLAGRLMIGPAGRHAAAYGAAPAPRGPARARGEGAAAAVEREAASTARGATGDDAQP